MTESDLRFTEIEHKYVVEARFDLAAFDQALTSLGPTRRATLQVRCLLYTSPSPRDS